MKINFTLLSTNRSGGVRAIFEIANGLSRCDHEVTITSLEGDHSWFPLEAEVIYAKKPNIVKILNPLNDRNGKGLTYSWIGSVLNKYKMGFEPNLIKPLAEAVPDCDINVATWFLTAFAVYRSGKGIPFYFFQDFHEIVKPLGQYYIKMFEESLYLPFHVITGSNWLKVWINENYMKNAVVSGYGIDHSIFYPRPPILDDFSEIKIMGIFSVGYEYKGGEDLINALNIVSKKLDTHLIMVSNKETFKELTSKNDIEFKYTFFERPDDNKLAELYSSSDLFAFSSHIEGYGLPPLEAMACGTPVVTTDCLGVRDFVMDGTNAILVPPRNPEAIADTILKVLEDGNLSDKLRRNGIKTAQKSTWDSVVDIFEKAFIDSLNEKI